MLIFKKFGIIENTTSKNKQTKEIAFPHKKIKRVFCFFFMYPTTMPSFVVVFV